MSETPEQIGLRLLSLFEAIIEEAAANPAFARKLEAAMMPFSERVTHALSRAPESKDAASPAVPAKRAHDERMLQSAMAGFDPLEVQLEVALMGGREHEVRAFLARLDRNQLEEVVTAQRLPGARALKKAISEAENPESAVDAIVGSAAQKVRGRYLAAS